MKKLLALVLVMILAVASLTACSISDTFTTVKETVGGWFGIEYDDEEDTNDDTQNPPAPTKTSAELAITFLNTFYANADEKTTANYELMAKVSVNGGAEVVNVVWTSNNAAVTITPSATDDTKVTVTVPAGGDEDLEYTITATVTDAAGNTKTVSYNRVVPSVNTFNTVEEYYAAKKGDKVIVKGIVTGIISKSTGAGDNNIYMNDLSGKGGYYVYKLDKDPITDLNLAVGMTVKVEGEKDVYYQTHEIKNATVTVLDTTITTVTPADYTNIFKNATALNEKALAGTQGLLVTIKGVELTNLEVAGSGFLYYHFKLGNLESYVGISHSKNNCMTQADADALVAKFNANKGNTADITGIAAAYDGNFYIVPDSVNSLSNFTAVTRTDEEKVQYELDALEAIADVKADGTVNLVIAGKTYTDVVISWVSDNNCAEVSADGKTVTFTIGDEVQTVTLTATAKLGDITKTRDITVKVAAKSKFVVNTVTNPVVGTAYKLYLYHTGLKRDMFFTGREDGYYFATTSDPSQAVDVYLEATDGGYYLTGTVDNVKRYFNIVSAYDAEQGKIFNNVTIDNSAITVYTFDATLKTLKTTTTCTDGAGKTVTETFIFGTGASKSYETISACYIGSASSTCIAYLVNVVNVNDMTDADKVAMEKDKLDVKTEVIEDAKIELPKATLSGVAVDWSVTGDATIADGKLVITLGDEAKTVVLTATIKSGEATDTKTFTFNVPKKPAEGTGIKADLETLPSTNGSYKTNTTTNGWVVTNGTLNTDVMGFAVVAINGKTSAVGSILSPVLSGGLTQITLKYANIFSESNGVDITVQIIQNGQVVAYKQLDNDNVSKATAYDFKFILDTPIEGEYQIKIVNNSPTNKDENKDRVAIWDLKYFTVETVVVPEVKDEDMVKAEIENVKIDVTEVSNDFKLTLPTPTKYADKVTFKWVVDGECAVISDGKLVITLPKKSTKITLTLEVVCGEAKDKKNFEIAVTVPTFTLNKVTAPVADKAYKLYLYQAQKGTNIFLTGAMEGNYFAVTTKAAEAVDVYLEATDGGYYLYIKNEDETKTYIDMYEYSKDKVGVRLNPTPTCVYFFSEEYGTILSTIKTESYTNDYYLGTYDANMYIRCNSTYYITGSNANKVGVSQYIAYLAEITCNHDYTADCSDTCNYCGETRTEVAEHKYDNACDATCNACGFERTVPGHTDEAGDGTCDNCGGSMAEVEKLTIEEAIKEVKIEAEYKNSVQFTLPTTIGKVTIQWKAEGVTLNGNVVTVKLGTEIKKATLFATFVCGGTTSDTVEYNLTLNAAPTLDIMEVIAPEAGKAYQLYFYQENTKHGIFLDGTIGTAKYYLTGSQMLNGALTAYLVEVDGGYNLKVVLADGTEKYLNVYEVTGGYINSLYETLEENDTPTVYTFDKTLGTLTVFIDATTTSKIGTYGMAAYSNYENVSAVKVDSSGNFFLKLVEAVCYHEYTSDCDDSCNACGLVRQEVTTHATYDNACDTTCICGYVREVPDHFDTVVDGKCDECQVDLAPLYEAIVKEVITGITLPTKTETGSTLTLLTLSDSGVKITWKSENVTIVTDENSVTTATFGAASGKATLVAKYTYATVTIEETYDIEIVKVSKAASIDKIVEQGLAFYIYAPKGKAYLVGELVTKKTMLQASDLSGATAFYLEPAKDAEGNVLVGQYWLYCKATDGSKLYIDATKTGTTPYSVDETADSLWSYDATSGGLRNDSYKDSKGYRFLACYQGSTGSRDFRAYYNDGSYDVAYIAVANCAHSFSTDCGACDICGEAQANAQHSYTDNCDTTCDGCGETRVAPHTYVSECDSTCTCGETREVNASHKSEFQCVGSCIICGETFTPVAEHVYGGCEDTDCDNGCGITREPIKHSYPYDCSTECNNQNCDEPRSAESCTDTNGDGVCDYGCGAEITVGGDVPALPV